MKNKHTYTDTKKYKYDRPGWIMVGVKDSRKLILCPSMIHKITWGIGIGKHIATTIPDIYNPSPDTVHMV